MEHLWKELNVLLKLLEHEHVSSATAEKMTVVRNLLGQLQPSVTGSDFIYMNTSLYGNGTSFVESLFEEFGKFLYLNVIILFVLQDQTQVYCFGHAVAETSKYPPSKSVSPTDTPPPLPTTPPPDDYYEEAVPLETDSIPQYITTHNNSSPPNSIEDAYYEDADNNYPITRLNGPCKNSYNDSDALSSSYESYDEEDEEAKGRERTHHQWPSEESPVGPMKDCRKCAFLLRKKRFGQWAKQLTIIRENRLQCFKNPKDRTPHTDLPLNLCSVIYVCKDGRRKKHELKFSMPGGESLVLAVPSKEQAESWLKAIQDVTTSTNSTTAHETSSSPMIPRKTELDKVSYMIKLCRILCMTPLTLLTVVVPEGKVKKGAFSELTGSMSRAAGRKITRIISFSKKKPPLPGETTTLTHTDDNPRCGYLNVLVNQCWKERWCCVRSGTLYLHKDRGDVHTHVNAVALRGVEVLPGLGPKHPFAFRIMREGNEVTALEASCSEEMGRWLGVLLAEAGCATTPEALHYDYVDVETISCIRDAARHSFLWATSSSSASTDSRTYDEVPYESVPQIEEAQPKSGSSVKRHSSFSSTDTPKGKPLVTVKRHGSSVNQYGKYGKTRAEEDARRYLNEKEQLEMEKEEIRKALVLLRKEKKEVKEDLKGATGQKQKDLEKRVAALEESCRGKEAERVDLELRLTEVKENLKKSLAGVNNPKGNFTNCSSPMKSESPYSETSLPVNCASEMRKRPPSYYASAKGNVMQKAKEWESKKKT
uniref:Actin filament-associated protein 1-like 1 n=1 Tax=Astyanax mexicanus TaxID=7994 RepID=A0A8B9K7Y2_ASTMX